ncbi:hypothetical protein CS022_19525 [Veronia nyctiphanis]|uniref:ATPase AAA-type core domain-containing protein n=1 Tax=Veronia nyctiphanis TaxID=1278244 RepID=A0A4Q0YLS8_9GAMM|nr:AAA family ATPase [Veronia nyctiphanis]RXJ71762.1 hypothetical protein CS022_19525 [Veronia nyctiphanis]
MIAKKKPNIVKNKRRPEWVEKFNNKINCHLIKTQRLIKTSSFMSNHNWALANGNMKITGDKNEDLGLGGNIYIIDEYSIDIANKISNAHTISADISRKQDRTFPQRLLSSNYSNLTNDEIFNKYEKIQNKILDLSVAGLIEESELFPIEITKINDTQNHVLYLYLNDLEEKLKVYDGLLKKIETFRSIISSKILKKSIKLNSKDGFSIELSTNKNDKESSREIQPHDLSSGEQHQIILFYDLIFKTDKHQLFLIDEPEISLHVDWQRRFINDILKVSEIGNHNFLVATHSPQIIGPRRDLAVALDGGILNV